jgi:hypothetical protein
MVAASTEECARRLSLQRPSPEDRNGRRGNRLRGPALEMRAAKSDNSTTQIGRPPRMHRCRRFDRLDVFTVVRCGGRPPAVAHGAQDLDEAHMAGLARRVAIGPPGLREDPPNRACTEHR